MARSTSTTTGPGDDGVGEAEADYAAGHDVHGACFWGGWLGGEGVGGGRGEVGTVEGETLDDCPDDHDAGSEHDAPSSTKGVVDDGDEGETEDGAEGEGGCEDAAVGAGGVAEIWLVSVFCSFR